MGQTRREVLKAGTAVAVAAGLGMLSETARAQPTHTRIPWDVFAQDSAKLDSFRRGVEVMRARKPSDPTSWWFQGAVHMVLAQRAADWAIGDPDVAGLDQARFWNQCPHLGQQAANFPLWHRAYTYYFERILRDAAQDPDLCVPYWNVQDVTGAGTTASRRLIPIEFAVPRLVAGGPPNPLFHDVRGPNSGNLTAELSAFAVDTSEAFDETDFFGAIDGAGFAGGLSDNDGRTRGAIERSVHDLIHVFVGNAAADVGRRGMASPPEAGYDPLFWIHHANIDRLWVEFVALPGKSWGTLPPQAWFDEAPWSFFDFDGTIKQEPRSFWMDHRTLGYGYDTEQPPQLIWPPPDAAPPPADPELFLLGAPGAEVFRSGPIRVTTKEGTLTRLSPGAQVQRMKEVASEATVETPMANRAERRLFLVLETPTFDHQLPASGFAVFVNPSEEDLGNPAARSRVGTITPFGLDHDQAQHQHMADEAPSGPTFDISEAVARGIMGQEDITVVIQPIPVETPIRAEAVAQPEGEISFAGLRILVGTRG